MINTEANFSRSNFESLKRNFRRIPLQVTREKVSRNPEKRLLLEQACQLFKLYLWQGNSKNWKRGKEASSKTKKQKSQSLAEKNCKYKRKTEECI
jgi:hypothetical protein